MIPLFKMIPWLVRKAALFYDKSLLIQHILILFYFHFIHSHEKGGLPKEDDLKAARKP